MFNGYSNIQAVALRIMEDYRAIRSARYATLYSLEQILLKVCEREESVASISDNLPSYIWWHMLPEGPVFDFGKRSAYLQDSSNPKRIVGNWPKQVNSDEGYDRLIGYDDFSFETYDFMIRNGISFNQKILSRMLIGWDGYGDDPDLFIDTEIIYVEPTRYIDIPFAVPVIDQPTFSRWSIA